MAKQIVCFSPPFAPQAPPADTGYIETTVEDEKRSSSPTDDPPSLQPAKHRRATGDDFAAAPAVEVKKKKKLRLPRLLKPWKWSIKKPAAALQPRAAVLERQLSRRPSREQVIASGVLPKSPTDLAAADPVSTNTTNKKKNRKKSKTKNKKMRRRK
mgnify:CR=1 FL=1